MIADIFMAAAVEHKCSFPDDDDVAEAAKLPASKQFVVDFFVSRTIELANKQTEDVEDEVCSPKSPCCYRGF